MIFAWLNNKEKRKRISPSFAAELLPLINQSARTVQITRERCQRIMGRNISELSVVSLVQHIENMESALDEVDAKLRDGSNRIIAQEERD